jgi:photosystem II stability/assembly factor-like uncharacterized protein
MTPDTHLYAALDDRLLVVDDGTATERLVGHDFECVAASDERPDRAFAGTVESGIQRTTDGGGTWERVSDIDDRVTALTVSPHDPDVVWAGTEPSAVYRSGDGGDTWTGRPGITDLPSSDEWSFPPRPHTHHVRWVSCQPDDPQSLYVAIEAGALVRTDDGGETWQDRTEGGRRDNHTLATHPETPERVYTAAGDGYAQSEDGGDTWVYPQEGLDHRYVWGLAVSADDPETVVVSAATGARRAHTPSSADAYVYRRVGDGAWERAMDGLPDAEGTVRSVLASRGGTFYAVNNRGLYYSETDGQSWNRLAIDWPDAYSEQTPRGLAVVA